MRYEKGQAHHLICHGEGPHCDAPFDWTPRSATTVRPEFCPTCRAARRSKGLEALWDKIQADSDARAAR